MEKSLSFQKNWLENLVLESVGEPVEQASVVVYPDPKHAQWMVNRRYERYEMVWVDANGQAYVSKYLESRRKWDIKKML